MPFANRAKCYKSFPILVRTIVASPFSGMFALFLGHFVCDAFKKNQTKARLIKSFARGHIHVGRIVILLRLLSLSFGCQHPLGLCELMPALMLDWHCKVGGNSNICSCDDDDDVVESNKTIQNIWNMHAADARCAANLSIWGGKSTTTNHDDNDRQNRWTNRHTDTVHSIVRATQAFCCSRYFKQTPRSWGSRNSHCWNGRCHRCHWVSHERLWKCSENVYLEILLLDDSTSAT